MRTVEYTCAGSSLATLWVTQVASFPGIHQLKIREGWPGNEAIAQLCGMIQ